MSLKDKFYFDRDIWSIGIANEFSKDGEIKDIKKIISAKDVTDIKWPRFVADPFLFKQNDRYYIFFEVYDNITSTGIIAYSYSDDGVNWTYGQIVLREKYHLSYPYIFEEDGEIYMIPEGGSGGNVKLYRATDFPNKWEVESVLLNEGYWDPSYVKKDGIHYLFVLETAFKKGDDKTRLFYSENLKSGWKEHPSSPIISNDTHITRPGGRIIKDREKLFRYTQDCYDFYGENVREFEILELTKESYKEKEIRIILNKDSIEGSWKKDGVHNIDYLNDNGNYLLVMDGVERVIINRYLERIKEKINGMN